MKSSLNVKFGIGAGLINCFAWYMLSRSMPYYEVISIDLYRLLFTNSLLIIGIFLSVFFERKANNGFLEFKYAFKTGILYAMLLALLLAVFNYLYYKFISPDSVEYYVSDQKKLAILAKKLKPEDFPKFEEAARSYFTSIRMFMTTVITGVIISLIAAGILHKKAPSLPFSEN
jgi:hypothetical protein